MISSFKFCIVLLLIAMTSAKRFQISNRNQISCKKDSDSSISKENFIICLSRFLKEESRNEDKEMLEEIAKNFVDSQNLERFFENQIQEYLKKDVENHVEQWKKEMHMILIKMLNIEYDSEFLEDMLKEPDFYGLTYDAYRILNFKFDDN